MTDVMLVHSVKRRSLFVEIIEDALNAYRVPYHVVFVDTYYEPRLQIGSGELIGQEIIDRFDEVLRAALGDNVFRAPCLECGQPAAWLRNTQFAGEHYFCTTHAEQESDFGVSNPSYFVWRELEPTSTA